MPDVLSGDVALRVMLRAVTSAAAALRLIIARDRNSVPTRGALASARAQVNGHDKKNNEERELGRRVERSRAYKPFGKRIYARTRAI